MCACIAVPLLEPGDGQKTPRSGSKSGSGRWSHWDEIGWVHYPEIGWSHSNEIRWVQSLEILHLTHHLVNVRFIEPEKPTLLVTLDSWEINYEQTRLRGRTVLRTEIESQRPLHLQASPPSVPM